MDVEPSLEQLAPASGRDFFFSCAATANTLHCNSTWAKTLALLVDNVWASYGVFFDDNRNSDNYQIMFFFAVFNVQDQGSTK
jgi:hypothetical protein